jgi:choline dehydrogenase-like flavoprotein
MDSFDIIVVGSGPAGTFAAFGARSRRVLMLDVGYDAKPAPDLAGNLYELRQRTRDLFPSLIGERFESLHNLRNRPVSLKLKSPYMSYIVRDWTRLTPITGKNFEGVLSLAKGGLANGWGAGVYRFTDRDLEGFPISATELRPFYEELTAHIGVSGANDDLEPYFERDEGLQPPLKLAPFFEEMLAAYRRKISIFRKAGVALGRPRLAVLTEPHRGREPYAYRNLEFFQPHDPAIYTPAYTLEEMIQAGTIAYRNGRLVLRYREDGSGVEVIARNLESGDEETYRAQKLLLGAGALNTARIVLESNADYETRLPLLDNPMECLPLFRLSRIGDQLPVSDTSLAQLNLVVDRAGQYLQGTLYGTTGPLRSDLLGSLPFSLSASMVWTKYLAPAMGLLMLFHPAPEGAGGYLRLRPSGELEVEFAPAPFGAAAELIPLFRRIGFFSHASLIQRPGMGAGLHFSGTLPMRSNPSKYETDRNGLLFGTQRVYVVDGGCFSRLPAKNLTFTIMANALRVGRAAAEDWP